MMAQKALLFDDIESYNKIMRSGNPLVQKSLGRKVKNFDEKVWAENRERIIYEGNIAKFTQNNDLKRKLIETGDAIICEGSPKDKIWGVGLRCDDPRVHDPNQWLGLNLLGEALMKVRNTITS
jgi:ribA/ribD-fused uncharacterized protein